MASAATTDHHHGLSLLGEIMLDLDHFRLACDPGLPRWLPAFREMFGASAVIALRHPDGGHGNDPFLHATGLDDAATRALHAAVTDPRAGSRFYPPLGVAPQARNAVLRTDDVATWAVGAAALLAPAGLAHHAALVVHLCEERRVLAFVMILRAHGFQATDAQLLAAVVPVLRRRLDLEARVQSRGLHALPLENALSSDGSGSAGVTDSSADRTVSRFDDERPTGVTPAPRAIATDPVTFASDRWKLTRQQTKVLGFLLRGMGNKSIASELGCSVRTVELHVSALLRRTGHPTRNQLLARLLTHG